MAARSLGEPVAARSLAGRAAVAVALLVGFYALALGIAGALLWVPRAEWHYGGRIHLKLGAGCAFGALAILWSLVPRRDAFEPPGPRLERADHPALFGALDRVAAKVGQALPREVFLEPDLNAWVASRGGAMGFGSHRVMGIGLPLLQVVDVPAFEAILAHEFGHYHGGDTRLGPWIYKTRAAIGRTLDALHGGWLQAPFRWYGNAFLRITQGISRAQEFTADRLAAVAIGAAPLARGLRAVHAYAGAFHAYWQSEALPVLRAGFHAPLTEGFASFVRVPHVESAVRDDLASALRAGDAHEFDSHPPLGERIAALGELAAEADAAAPRALSLLGDVVAVEQALLAFLGGRETRFSPVAWSEVPEQVFLPAWQRQRAELGAALGGLTWGALPEALRTRGPELARAVHGLPAPVAEDEVAPRSAGRSAAASPWRSSSAAGPSPPGSAIP